MSIKDISNKLRGSNVGANIAMGGFSPSTTQLSDSIAMRTNSLLNNIYQRISENSIIMSAIHAEVVMIPDYFENIQTQLGIIMTRLIDDMESVFLKTGVLKDTIKSEENEREDATARKKQLTLLEKILAALGMNGGKGKDKDQGLGGWGLAKMWMLFSKGGIIASALAAIGTFFGAIGAFFRRAWNTLKWWGNVLKGIGKGILKISRGVAWLVAETSKLIVSTWKAFKKSKLFGWLTTKVTQAWSWVKNTRLFAWIKNVFGKGGWVATKIAESWKWMKTTKLFTWVFGLFGRGGWFSLQAAKIMTALRGDALFMMLADIFGKNGWIATKFTQAWKWVRGTKLFAWLGTIFSKGGWLSAKISGIFTAIKGSKMFVWVTELFGKSGWLATKFSNLMSMFKSSKIFTLASRVFGKLGIMGLLKGIGSLLGKLFIPITALFGLYDSFKELMSGGGIARAISGFFGGMLEFFTFGIIKSEWIKDGVEWLGNKLGEVIGWIWYHASNSFGYITDFFLGIPGMIADAFIAAGAFISSMYTTIYDSVKEFIMAPIKMLMGVLGGIADWIMDIIPDAAKDYVDLSAEGVGVVADAVTDPLGTGAEVAKGAYGLGVYAMGGDPTVQGPDAAWLENQKKIRARHLAAEAAEQKAQTPASNISAAGNGVLPTAAPASIVINAPSTTNTTTAGSGGGTIITPQSTRQNETAFQRQQNSTMSSPFV